MVIFRLFALSAGLFAPPSASACDLALLLAIDVSGSVDSKEFRIQMDGLSEGLRDSIVSEALVRAQAEIMLMQWTGSSRQQITIPWTRIDSFEALEVLAERIGSDGRVWRNYSTAIGEALAYSISAFSDVGHCKRHLIDISGDGVSNEGLEPDQVHQELRDAGIMVNAIAIEETEPDLTAYFYENVIVGDGAFVVSARGFRDYPERIRKKLLREVTRQSVQSR